LFPPAEVGDKAWTKGALAIHQNLLVRRHCGGGNRLSHKVGRQRAHGDGMKALEDEAKGEEREKEKKFLTSIFAVRTTAGQEKNVANLIAARVKANNLPVTAILIPETLKGYVFVEAEGPHFVEEAIAGVKHVRSRVPGKVDFEEIERYIIAKPIIEELSENDVVEVIGGPFKGMKAKITRVDRTKEEITVELLEATFTLPITIHADHVKLIEKAKKKEV